MEVFIANPIEPVESGLNKTKIISVLFDKSKWDKDEILKWIKSRFVIRSKPKVSDEAKYYHVRVARQNKKYDKRTITLSKNKGIKAIIELVPVNIHGVYNYTKDIESSDDVSYNTDMSKDVSYNIKVTPKIKDAIMNMSDLPSGTIQKLIRDRFGINISTTTINRYKKGIAKNIESEISKDDSNFDKKPIPESPISNDKVLSDVVVNHWGEYMNMLGNIKSTMESFLEEVLTKATDSSIWNEPKAGVFVYFPLGFLTYPINVDVNIPIKRVKGEDLSYFLTGDLKALLTDLFGQAGDNVSLWIEAVGKPRFDAMEMHKRLQHLIPQIEKKDSFIKTRERIREMKRKFLKDFTKDLLKKFAKSIGSCKVDVGIGKGKYEGIGIYIEVPPEHINSHILDYIKEAIKKAIYYDFAEVYRSVGVYIEPIDEHNSTESYIESKDEYETKKKRDVSFGIGDMVEDGIDKKKYRSGKISKLEYSLPSFLPKDAILNVINEYYYDEDYEEILTDIEAIIRNFIWELLSKASNSLDLKWKESGPENDIFVRFSSYYLYPTVISMNLPLRIHEVHGGRKEELKNWKELRELEKDITKILRDTVFDGLSKDIVVEIKPIDDPRLVYEEPQLNIAELRKSIQQVLPTIERDKEFREIKNHIKDIKKKEIKLLKGFIRDTFRPLANSIGAYFLCSVLSPCKVDVSLQSRYERVSVIVRIPSIYTNDFNAELLKAIIKSEIACVFPEIVSDVEVQIKFTDKLNNFTKGENTRSVISSVENAIEEQDTVKKQAGTKSKSYESTDSEVLGIYDRQGLMSLVRVGDKLFLVLNNTGATIGEVLYKAGKYVVKKGRKYIHLDNKKINKLLKNKGGM